MASSSSNNQLTTGNDLTTGTTLLAKKGKHFALLVHDTRKTYLPFFTVAPTRYFKGFKVGDNVAMAVTGSEMLCWDLASTIMAALKEGGAPRTMFELVTKTVGHINVNLAFKWAQGKHDGSFLLVGSLPSTSTVEIYLIDKISADRNHYQYTSWNVAEGAAFGSGTQVVGVHHQRFPDDMDIKTAIYEARDLVMLAAGKDWPTGGLVRVYVLVEQGKGLPIGSGVHDFDPINATETAYSLPYVLNF